MKPTDILKWRVITSTLALAVAGAAQAAELTIVPMQGSMVHANVLYLAAQNRLEVHVDPTIPALTPLDTSNPLDQFAPADPWYACLDPSRQGQAFNRQYGFVMDAAGDTPPANLGVWIRHIASTPGLALYRYRSGGMRSWDPIFQTAGTTNLFEWNLSMFHPAAAAPPKAGTHSAQFEAFLVDLATGQPVPGVAAAPFTLNWTILPSARELRMGPDFVLSWGPVTNYVVEWKGTLPGSLWTEMMARPTVQNGRCAVQCDGMVGQRFYRLRRLP